MAKVDLYRMRFLIISNFGLICIRPFGSLRSRTGGRASSMPSVSLVAMITSLRLRFGL